MARQQLPHPRHELPYKLGAGAKGKRITVTKTGHATNAKTSAASGSIAAGSLTPWRGGDGDSHLLR